MFVALDLPEQVLDYIDEWGERELGDPALRRIPRESLHVTLAFLGDRPLEEVERIECGDGDDRASTRSCWSWKGRCYARSAAGLG